MKTLAYNIFAALAIASAANAEMLTFEDLPQPTHEMGDNFKVAAMPRMYQGFSFTSSHSGDDDSDMFDGRWGFYRIRFNEDHGGFDNGLIGNRALFTPWGAYGDYAFTVSRAEQFVFEGAFIAQANTEDGDDDFDSDFNGGDRNYSILTVTGWIGDEQVWVMETQIEYQVGQFIDFNTGIAVDRLTFETNTGAAITLDNFTFSSGAVPAPSALALLGLSGLVGKRKRNRN